MAAPSRRIPGIPETEPAPTFVSVSDLLTLSFDDAAGFSVLASGRMPWPLFRIGAPSSALVVTGNDVTTISLSELTTVLVTLAVNDVLTPTFDEPTGASVFSDVNDNWTLSLSESASVQADDMFVGTVDEVGVSILDMASVFVAIDVADELYAGSMRLITVTDTLP